MRVVIFLLLMFSAPAWAEKRVAFIVGNSDYAHAPPLENPSRDVALIASTLTDLDFEVTQHENLTRNQIGRELASFLRDTKDADVTLFYFAGHGMQYDGTNYLVGVDAQLQTEFDIDGEALELNKVVELLERNSRAALIFIDACRDNPLANQFYTQNFSETRALATRGLAPINSPFQGSMITFSASPGQVAYDGTGANSPFAAALARHLPTENLEVLSLMKRVIRDVKAETGDLQSPMVTNDLTAEIYLKLGSGGTGGALALQQEQALFEAASDLNSLRAWDIFLQRHPTGTMREMALAAREALQVEEIANDAGVEVAELLPQTVGRDVAAGVEAKLGLTRDDARAVQAALNLRGYAAGPEDGQIGRRTRKAIADFQAAQGLASTGVVTLGTAKALKIDLATPEFSSLPIVSSTNARRYDPKTLALLESDPRLLKAAHMLADKEFVYGYYENRLYIGVLTWCCQRFSAAKALAEQSGGHLATLTNPQENDFAFRLVKNDKRFWRDHRDNSYVGPTFGLHQTEGAREPDGGWGWLTSEPANWIPWFPGQPNNSGDGQAIMAAFFNEPPIPHHRWADAHVVHTGIIIEIE